MIPTDTEIDKLIADHLAIPITNKLRDLDRPWQQVGEREKFVKESSDEELLALFTSSSTYKEIPEHRRSDADLIRIARAASWPGPPSA